MNAQQLATPQPMRRASTWIGCCRRSIAITLTCLHALYRRDPDRSVMTA